MTRTGGLAYDRYALAGCDEWLMRIGPADGRPIMILPPLLEEMNRTRALIAAVMRGLAGRGFGCWLVDLPGTGESAKPLEACLWGDWQAGAKGAAAHIAATAGKRPALVSLRGGCLIDEDVESPSYWRFAPAEGASLARDLVRSSLVVAGEASDGPLQLAGYTLGQNLFGSLKSAVPGAVAPLRTVRLASDRADADVKIEGPALWRRSEPGNSPELATALAADIAGWLDRCADS